MWYSRDRKFLFLHVPKTGGSSVKNTLMKRLKVRLEEPRKKFKTRIGHESLSCVDFKASRIDPKTFFSFAFVRNPYDRAVSMYNHIRSRRFKDRRWFANFSFHRFCRDLEKVHLHYLDLRYRYGMNKGHILASNSEKRLFDTQNKGMLGRYWWMAMPMTEFIDGPVHFVGRFENLQRDFDRVCKSLRLPAAKLRHDGRSLPIRIKPYKAYFNDETRIIVEKVYSKDLELFDYSF